MTTSIYVPNLRNTMLYRAKEFAHALQSLVKIFHRSRVREADMFRRAEAFSRNRRHVHLMQQAVRDVGAALHSALPEKRRYVRIRVERAFRHGALHTRNRPQAADNVVAQVYVLGEHVGHALLRTVQRRHRCLLHNRRWIRSRLALQFMHRVHHHRRAQRESQAPAGHGVGLRKRSDHQKPVAIYVQRSHREILARAIEIHVALVGNHPDAALMRQAHNLSHIRRTHDRARRIRWRIQNNQLRLRRDQAFHHLRGDAEALRFVGLKEHAVAAHVAHHVFERDPVGHRQNHFVAVVDQHRDDVEERVLAAHRSARFLALVGGSEIGGVPADDRVLQFDRAAHRRVLRKISLNGRNSGVFNVLRRREVRLAGSRVDYVDSLLSQLFRLGHGGQGGGRLNAADALRQADGASDGRDYSVHLLHAGVQRACVNPAQALFFLDLLGPSAASPFSNLRATSIFSRSFRSTRSGTRQAIEPPSCATSRTNREHTYEYFSAGSMNTVSNPGWSLRFISAIWSSYS